MSTAAELNEAAQPLLEMYPLRLRRSSLLQAVCRAYGYEFQLLNEALDTLQRNLIPATVDDERFVARWERELDITVAPGATMAQRVDGIVSMYQRAALLGTAVDWRRLATRILGTNWTWQLGGTNNAVLTITTALDPNSFQARLAERMIGEFTPAPVLVNVIGGDGARFDQTLLDQAAFR